MVRAKRGQAALEFLMTYGWAFLVIMIMIGALAYFGVLSPERFLPDRCKFGTPVLCKGEQYVVKAQGNGVVVGAGELDDATIRARVINNFGKNVRIKNISLSTDYAGVCGTQVRACLDVSNNGECENDERIDVDAGANANVTWEAGEGHDLVIDCQTGGDLTAGDKVKWTIEGEWWPTASSYTYGKPFSGEIYSGVSE